MTHASIPRFARAAIYVLLPIAVQLCASRALAQNFTCPDAELAAWAEQARIESAVFWSGDELPGRWSAPCPITISDADHNGGGATTFTFNGGEVYGWRMQISGRREALIDDVVPHEVDHMVRASLVRRPIPRWLDEGCACVMESQPSQQRLRDEARRLIESGRTHIDAAWLDRMDYPSNGEEVAALYAIGHSLVEFLIDRAGPQRLLEFQLDSRPPSEKLDDFYSIEAGDLVAAWRGWLIEREAAVAATDDSEVHQAVECPLLFPGEPCSYSGPNLLTVFTSRTCGPCHQFWYDLDTDAAFREELMSRFHVHRVDVDWQPLLARQANVDSVPAFITPRGRVTGYLGKEWLLAELAKLMPAREDNDAAGPSVNDDAAPPSNSISDEASGPPSASTDPVAASETPPLQGDGHEPDFNPPTSARPPINTLPIALTLLQWAGIIGGSAATGGVGTLAIWGIATLLRRRRAQRSTRHDYNATSEAHPSTPQPEDAEEASCRAPFPRELDEARELLQLGRSEGRVAVLDTLRGMFLDDELDKAGAESEEQGAWSRQLREAIDTRVNEVAPLSVQ